MATMTYTAPNWQDLAAPAMTGGPSGTMTLLSQALASIGASGSDQVRAAGTVPDYGVGAISSATTTGLKSLTVNGLYSYLFTNADAPSGQSGVCLVQIYNSSNKWLIAQPNGVTDTYILRMVGGAWDASWSKIWTSLDDGNGGQPPAPKPQIASGGSVAGYWQVVTATAGSALVVPSGGTWAIIFTDGTSATWTVTTVGASVQAGGTTVLGATAQAKMMIAWRIAL